MDVALNLPQFSQLDYRLAAAPSWAHPQLVGWRLKAAMQHARVKRGGDGCEQDLGQGEGIGVRWLASHVKCSPAQISSICAADPFDPNLSARLARMSEERLELIAKSLGVDSYWLIDGSSYDPQIDPMDYLDTQDISPEWFQRTKRNVRYVLDKVELLNSCQEGASDLDLPMSGGPLCPTGLGGSIEEWDLVLELISDDNQKDMVISCAEQFAYSSFVEDKGEYPDLHPSREFVLNWDAQDEFVSAEADWNQYRSNYIGNLQHNKNLIKDRIISLSQGIIEFREIFPGIYEELKWWESKSKSTSVSLEIPRKIWDKIREYIDKSARNDRYIAFEDREFIFDQLRSADSPQPSMIGKRERPGSGKKKKARKAIG